MAVSAHGAEVDAAAATLAQAVADADRDGARLAAAQLLNTLGRPGAALADGSALSLLKALIGRRWFDIADPLADSFVRAPDTAVEVQRRAAQVMIERGRHAAALRLLLPLRRHPQAPQSELVGHIGRVFKQQFVDSVELGEPDAALLARATRIYLDAWDEAPASRGWHGINAVALLKRCAEFPGANGFAARPPEAIAHAVLQSLQAPGAAPLDHWGLATAAEAALALGDLNGAGAWLRRYVADPQADSFAIGATLRQFDEIWRLAGRPEPEALGLRDLMRATLLLRQSGAVTVTRADVAQARAPLQQGYEAVFGADQFQSLKNYRLGLERSACVARIGRSSDVGIGTGFLVDAAALGLKGVQGPVLVTNAHVLSTADAERQQGALHPDEAVVTFAAMPEVPEDQVFAVGPVLFSSPRTQLDVTVVSLTPPPPTVVPIPLAAVLPVRGGNALVRVIGHPGGRGLSFSVNQLLDHEDPRVHYRTATEGGSSGSPAFNQDWKLIALHHAGGTAMPKLNGQSDTYEANEGIWIGAIRAAITAAGA